MMGLLLHDDKPEMMKEKYRVMFSKMKEMIWTELKDQSGPRDPPNFL